ncbi:protein prenylyltransferase [Auricularia subglabra TFB-10046 SS5]|nr:protein prenylyltransferase [Auricularia subglabra TFB-10046 SS5]
MVNLPDASPPLTVDGLASQFPVSWPVPTPVSHPDMLSPKDMHKEEDLLRNPHSFRHWWAAITTARDVTQAMFKAEPAPQGMHPDVAALLGPLANPDVRAAFQRVVYLFEAALEVFPASFKLWKAYLQTRSYYVLGRAVKPKRAGGRKKFAPMKDDLDAEMEDLEKWDGGLDGIVGWAEWKALVATFERALMWLPNMPRLWLLYFNLFFHPKCPPAISVTHARRTFDRALRTLPPSLHSRIWVRYLLWSETKGGAVTVSIYRRYLAVDPSVTERYVSLLLAPENPAPRPLEAAKLMLSLARKAQRGEYESAEGKSPYQLLGDWLEIVENFAEEVGVDVEETEQLAAARAAEGASEEHPAPAAATAPVSKDESLIRFAGPPQPVAGSSAPYSAEEDPSEPSKLDVEGIIHRDGLNVYKDQAGRLWAGIAKYWIKRSEFDRARETFEKGLASVVTIRDFTQIFEAYTEFSESLISALMDHVAGGGDDEDDLKETERELDERMQAFEELMDRRPFLVNDVLLRRNPNDVQEWEKRVALYGEDDEKVVETYTKAIETVVPRKATANCHRLYINFARFYEDGGTAGTAEHDLDSARKIFEKGVKVPFKTVDDLAEVWCEWAEMELRHDNYDEAIRVIQRATALPKNTKISYHDQSLPVQARLFKSLKLWSFFIDLEESIGTVESTKAAYDKVMELRIANAQIIINYAAFLEENKYYEESFKVYERGVELFTYPVAFEIWNTYLAKFIRRYGGAKIERARDLFEQALENCPPKFSKALFLLYGKLEEDHGLAKRAMNIYQRATEHVADDDKFAMFEIYIAKAAENFGLPATRDIYERAIEVLPDRQTAQMCVRFAAMKRKLGEIDRARALYAHASQFCDPRVHADFWQSWRDFEAETGSDDTFREMLRIKRSVQAKYNTEASYIAAQTLAAREGKTMEPESTAQAVDAMAAAEQARGGFVAAKHGGPPREPPDGAAAGGAPAANAEEIQIDDDDM